MTDTTTAASSVMASVDLWPKKYKKRITIKTAQVSYPKQRQYMKYLGSPCCTERLFIPNLLPKYGAAIYLDTDFVFMRPPEDLWDIFKDFGPHQLAGMAVAHKSYKFRNITEHVSIALIFFQLILSALSGHQLRYPVYSSVVE